MTKEDSKLSRIGNKVLDMADLYGMAGVAVGILSGDEVFTGARGCRNYVTKKALHAEDIFHCASISKTFTSMGIMKLVEEKKLDLNDRLVDLLPYLSIADKRCQEIRLHHMLSHVAGLPMFEDLGWEAAEKSEDASRKYAVSEEVSNVVMHSDPDDMFFMYSDLTYDLLGLVITETTGENFEDFIAKNFFEPAGMNDTTFLTFERTGGSVDLEDIDKVNMAMPYSRNILGWIMPEHVYPYSRQHAPSSTLTSNVRDLLKWARYNIDKKAVSQESYDRMWTKRVDAPDKEGDMGMGWFVRTINNCDLVGHEGGDVGFRTSFWICPERDVAMAILSNTSEAPIEPLNEIFFSELVEML